jgi:hypothetical protein
MLCPASELGIAFAIFLSVTVASVAAACQVAALPLIVVYGIDSTPRSSRVLGAALAIVSMFRFALAAAARPRFPALNPSQAGRAASDSWRKPGMRAPYLFVLLN